MMHNIDLKNIKEIDNALIFPVRKDDFGGGKDNKVLFGVYDLHHNMSYNHQRNNRVWQDESARSLIVSDNEIIAEKIEGSWLYAGPLFFHFGHFISESISRLWGYYKLKGNIDGVIFSIPPHMKAPKLPGYMIECFSLFGLKEEDVILTNKFHSVDKLYVPELGTILGIGGKDWYNEELENINITQKIDVKSTVNKTVFFSRRNFKVNGRNMGMDYFESSLSKSVEIVIPEEISLKEQLKYILNSNTIIFEEGSSIHLLDLIPRTNKKLILIKRREGKSYLEHLLSIKTTDLSIYSEIIESPLIFKSDARHNICSKLASPIGFLNFLKEHSFVDESFEFNEAEFQKSETEDIKTYLFYKAKSEYDYFK